MRPEVVISTSPVVEGQSILLGGPLGPGAAEGRTGTCSGGDEGKVGEDALGGRGSRWLGGGGTGRIGPVAAASGAGPGVEGRWGGGYRLGPWFDVRSFIATNPL